MTEVGLALEHVPARFVAITGTQGKSSTCRMTADLLRAAGFDAVVAGQVKESIKITWTWLRSRRPGGLDFRG